MPLPERLRRGLLERSTKKVSNNSESFSNRKPQTAENATGNKTTSILRRPFRKRILPEAATAKPEQAPTPKTSTSGSTVVSAEAAAALNYTQPPASPQTSTYQAPLIEVSTASSASVVEDKVSPLSTEESMRASVYAYRPSNAQNTRRVWFHLESTLGNKPTAALSKQQQRPTNEHPLAAVQHWIKTCHSLSQSNEFQAVVQSSTHVVHVTVHHTVATLLYVPVTLPRQALTQASSLWRSVLEQQQQLLVSIIPNNRKVLPSSRSTSSLQKRSSQVGRRIASLPELIVHAWQLPFRWWDAATEQLEQGVDQYVNGNNQDDIDSGEDHDLDRLRLSFGKEQKEKAPCRPDPPADRILLHKSHSVGEALSERTSIVCSSPEVAALSLESATPVKKKKPTAVRTSSVLLFRINDMNVSRSPEGAALYCLDLEHLKDSTESNEQPLLTQALDKLVQYSLSVMESVHKNDKTLAKWKPEGSTTKLLRKIQQNDSLSVLMKETLVWSGERTGSKVPMFLARGILPMSPRELLHLLWDNERTGEYNPYCMGRTTVLDLQKAGDLLTTKTLDSEKGNTKVIHSGMRVPFTNMSVQMHCLMHAVELKEADSFAIFSRSLFTGPAGTSTRPVSSDTSNEIIMGLNVMRAVPGRPDCVELVSLSQVASAVPRFLAHRIGMMGIEDFFGKVRILAQGK